MAGEADPADFALGLLTRDRLSIITEDTPERARRDARTVTAWDQQHNRDPENTGAHHRDRLLAAGYQYAG